MSVGEGVRVCVCVRLCEWLSICVRIVCNAWTKRNGSSFNLAASRVVGQGFEPKTINTARQKSTAGIASSIDGLYLHLTNFLLLPSNWKNLISNNKTKQNKNSQQLAGHIAATWRNWTEWQNFPLVIE